MTDDSRAEQDINEVLTTLSEKNQEDLKRILNELLAEEERLSYRRRILHGRIDIVREELVTRMKGQAQSGELLRETQDIVDKLSEILAKEGTSGGGHRRVNPDMAGDEDVFD